MKRRLLIIGCRFLLTGFFACVSVFMMTSTGYSGQVRGVTDTTIIIGSISDQTGPVADICLPLAKGHANYIRHINDKGGINGRKIKLLLEDDHYSIPIGIAAFKKLLFKDEILALIGPASVGESRVLYDQFKKHKVPALVEAPDEHAIDPYRRYVFMPLHLYDEQIGVIFDYLMNDFKAKNPKVAFCYFDAESGKVARASAKKWADFFGVKLHFEVIPLGALEAASQVLSMKRAGVNLIVIHHTAPGTILLLRELRKFGINIPVFGDLITCTEDTVRVAGNASKNYIGTHAFSPWYDKSPGMAQMREVTLTYFPGTDKPYRSISYTMGWAVSTILCEGIKRAGNDLTPETLVDSLESIRNLDLRGVCGPITITSESHKALSFCRLFRADPGNGILIPISEWRRPPKER